MPPAFALSQDQTLRFISTTEPMPGSINERDPLTSANIATPQEVTIKFHLHVSIYQDTPTTLHKQNAQLKGHKTPNQTSRSTRPSHYCKCHKERRQRIPSIPDTIFKEQTVTCEPLSGSGPEAREAGFYWPTKTMSTQGEELGFSPLPARTPGRPRVCDCWTAQVRRNAAKTSVGLELCNSSMGSPEGLQTAYNAAWRRGFRRILPFCR